MEDKILNLLEAMSAKFNTIYDQTADLTEFRTETRQRLDWIENGIEVLRQQDYNSKVELVEIKKKIAK